MNVAAVELGVIIAVSVGASWLDEDERPVELPVAVARPCIYAGAGTMAALEAYAVSLSLHLPAGVPWISALLYALEVQIEILVADRANVSGLRRLRLIRSLAVLLLVRLDRRARAGRRALKEDHRHRLAKALTRTWPDRAAQELLGRYRKEAPTDENRQRWCEDVRAALPRGSESDRVEFVIAMLEEHDPDYRARLWSRISKWRREERAARLREYWHRAL